MTTVLSFLPMGTTTAGEEALLEADLDLVEDFFRFGDLSRQSGSSSFSSLRFDPRAARGISADKSGENQKKK